MTREGVVMHSGTRHSPAVSGNVSGTGDITKAEEETEGERHTCTR